MYKLRDGVFIAKIHGQTLVVADKDAEAHCAVPAFALSDEWTEKAVRRLRFGVTGDEIAAAYKGNPEEEDKFHDLIYALSKIGYTVAD